MKNLKVVLGFFSLLLCLSAFASEEPQLKFIKSESSETTLQKEDLSHYEIDNKEAVQLFAFKAEKKKAHKNSF